MPDKKIALAGLMMTLLCAAAATADWPMYQQNPSHTGYNPVALDPGVISLRWEEKIGPISLTPAAASGGLLFVSTTGYFSDQHTFAVDAAEGTVLWSKDFGSIYSVNPPAYAYGNVYVQTGNHGGDTYLRAYEAVDGTLVFRSAHSAQWERYYAPTPYDGKVYINGGYYGGMYSFDAYSGTQDWFLTLPQYDEWTPAVDESYVYAYVGSYNPGLYVANRHTGIEAFMIPDPNFDWNGWSMDLAPVLGENDNVLAIHDGRLISFDLAGKTIGWEIKESFKGQPSLAKGVLYCINSGALQARDEVTGNLLWSWEVPSVSLQGEIVVTDGHLFVCSDTSAYMVDLDTHKEVWSVDRSGHLALDEENLYIVWGDGWITAYQTAPDAFPYLTHHGSVVPGGELDIEVRSFPNAGCTLFMGSGLLDPPWSTPYGLFWLGWPITGYYLGTIPPGGTLVRTVNLPLWMQPGESYPFQAFTGARLTNLDLWVVDRQTADS